MQNPYEGTAFEKEFAEQQKEQAAAMQHENGDDDIISLEDDEPSKPVYRCITTQQQIGGTPDVDLICAGNYWLLDKEGLWQSLEVVVWEIQTGNLGIQRTPMFQDEEKNWFPVEPNFVYAYGPTNPPDLGEIIDANAKEENNLDNDRPVMCESYSSSGMGDC